VEKGGRVLEACLYADGFGQNAAAKLFRQGPGREHIDGHAQQPFQFDRRIVARWR
jgi:hypothetical protein